MPGDFKILATDVTAKVPVTVAAVEYSERELARGLTTLPSQHSFQMTARGRTMPEKRCQLVVFRRINLLLSFVGLSVFDRIVRRNGRIDCDDATRQRRGSQVDELLAADGILLLGWAENLFGVSDPFESRYFNATLVYRLQS
jgi:chemotaxis methyl-accepting protein methylase